MITPPPECRRLSELLERFGDNITRDGIYEVASSKASTVRVTVERMFGIARTALWSLNRQFGYEALHE
jgi:hypothetical protein